MTKRFFIGLFLAFFCVISIFGQTPPPPIWTTVNGSSVRNIPMNSVKAEVLRIANQYRFFGIEDHSRSAYTASIPTGGNGPLLRAWVNNNQNYVFALQDRTNLFGISIDLAQVFFIKGDRVHSLSFHQNQSALSSNSIQNDRRYLEQLIDTYLSGMASSSNQTNTQNISTITIRNNTGYPGDAFWIRRAGSDDWGNRINIENGIIRNGQTSTVRLLSAINTGNRFDVALRDTDGDFYIKTNIQITSNGITFTFDDFVSGN